MIILFHQIPPKMRQSARFPGQSANLPVSRWKSSIGGWKKRSVQPSERQFATLHLFRAPTRAPTPTSVQGDQGETRERDKGMLSFVFPCAFDRWQSDSTKDAMHKPWYWGGVGHCCLAFWPPTACYRGPKPDNCPNWLGEVAKRVLVCMEREKKMRVVQKQGCIGGRDSWKTVSPAGQNRLGPSSKHFLDGPNRQSPITSVQRTRSTLAGHSAGPSGKNTTPTHANRATRIAVQRTQGLRGPNSVFHGETWPPTNASDSNRCDNSRWRFCDNSRAISPI